ncbi:MAG TPA: hypothetical protein VF624_15505 [Tepidisphaeraceae bacterium]|jgi:hypothetical protein
MIRSRIAFLAAFALSLSVLAQTPPQLGERFVGMYDVSFQPIGDAVRTDNKGVGEIVRYENAAKKWTLVLTRTELATPVQLHDTRDVSGAQRPGYLSAAINELRKNDASADVFRNEIVDYADLKVGIITAIAKPGGAGAPSVLLQQAVVAVSPRLYYGLVLTMPFAGGDPQSDPAVGDAVAAFKAVLETLEPVDLSKIRQEQEDRLIRTRALFVNWTKPRLLAALVPERLLRFRQDGRDVGYAFVVEEPANTLPRKGQNRDTVDPNVASGLRVGMRMRTAIEAGKNVETESWMYVSFDRKHEVWSTTTISSEPGAATQKERENWRLDLGTSDMVEDRVFGEKRRPEEFKDLDQKNRKNFDDKKNAPDEVPFHIVDKMRLSVTTKQRSGELPPVKRDVPPFYLQQALSLMLPRLLPLTEPNTYAFASYSSEGRQIMMRYVDVLPEADVTLGGRAMRAVCVVDRLGYEGQPITHYLTPAGAYLGSVTPSTKLEVTLTDRETLAGVWKDLLLTAPSAQ